MSLRPLLASLALALLATGALADSAPTTDWATFRGPLGSGAAPGQAGAWPAPPALATHWQVPLGSGYSGVSIAAGRVVTAFAADGADWLGAFDLESGAELWRLRLADVYSGHDGSHDGPIATPAIAGDRVAALAPRGELVVAEAATGKEVWRRDIDADDGGVKPHYGHGSSPLILAGNVIVADRVEGRSSIAAFRLADGEPAWWVGDDPVNYQSALALRLGGIDQVVASSDTRVWGLDAGSGTVLWEHEHGGDFNAAWMAPLPVGSNGLLVTASRAEATLLEVTRGEDGTFAVAPKWTTKALGRTYAPTVAYDGVIYGYSGAFLSAIDAATGERLWRSRPPGDGFLAIADGTLVVLTKQGTLHLAPASREGWKESASMQLFEDHTWTPPSLAGGRIYARGMSRLASVEVTSGEAAKAHRVAGAELAPDSKLAALVRTLPADATERAAAIDRFLADHAPDGPLVEGRRLVLLYRGEGTDLGVVGSMIGARIESPMTRVEGTDLFWWAADVEPAARIEYAFVRDFEERIADPRNPRSVPTPNPAEPSSWVGMAEWQAPAFSVGEPGRPGRLERIEIPLATAETAAAGQDPAGDGEEQAAAEPKPTSRNLDVWLPPGYDDDLERRYPVAYVHLGDEALEIGGIGATLDRLAGSDSFAPLIVVFIHRLDPKGYAEMFDGLDEYLASIPTDIVPVIDSTFRTLADRDHRAVVGAGYAGQAALVGALRDPGVFGRVSVQSTFSLTEGEQEVLELAAAEPALHVDFEWGRYDLRADHEGWDMRQLGQRLADGLRAKGHTVATRETLDGFGWGSWALRADVVYGGLFD